MASVSPYIYTPSETRIHGLLLESSKTLYQL